MGSGICKILLVLTADALSQTGASAIAPPGVWTSAGASHKARTGCHKGLLSGQRPEKESVLSLSSVLSQSVSLQDPAYHKCHYDVSNRADLLSIKKHFVVQGGADTA